MAFDFKKEYKEFYMPKNKPDFVTEADFAWAIEAFDDAPARWKTVIRHPIKKK